MSEYVTIPLDIEGVKVKRVEGPQGGTMDGFRRMLWVGRQHSADHIPVSALQLVTRRWFRAVGRNSGTPRIAPYV